MNWIIGIIIFVVAYFWIWAIVRSGDDPSEDEWNDKIRPVAKVSGEVVDICDRLRQEMKK